MEPEVPLQQITTRIPADLAEQLNAIAQRERRSLSNLLVFAVELLVQRYKEQYEAQSQQ